jgi:hypothetical protein
LLGDHDRLTFLGEYAQLVVESDAETVQKYPDIAPRMGAYYLELQYRFFPESWRKETLLFGDESSFALAFRYESIDMDTRKTGVSRLDDQKIYTLGFHFSPIEQTVFRVEYNWIREMVLARWAWNNRVLVSFATFF